MDDDRVFVDMASLSVDEEAEDALVFEEDVIAPTDDPNLCLVGRFLTDRHINFPAIRQTIASL